ncbi:MAG: GNAT family N-acetyltransferase [Pyrinomonadaceae bacterium]
MTNGTEIETERLCLRPFTPEDVDAVHRLWTDKDVRRYIWDDEAIPRERAAAVIDESRRLFESEGFGLWAASPRAEDALIGFCGYWYFHEPPELQLLYGLAPASWGRGLAAEAARAMIRFGFEELSLDRVVASADAPNEASFRVMEKAGMTFEKRVLMNDRDTVYYAITREEFRPDDSTYVLRRL